MKIKKKKYQVCMSISCNVDLEIETFSEEEAEDISSLF